MPVGKLGNKFKGIPRLGNKLSLPIFGNRPTGVNIPRGPAKLPSNFIKNIPLLGNTGRGQSQSARANLFNGPLRRLIPSLGHMKSVRNKAKKVKKKGKK